MMTKAPIATLVLALGNPLRGDDGVGAAVLNALPDFPPGVTGLDGGTPGLGLVLSLRTPDSDLHGTLHDAGLAEALLLGEALGLTPAVAAAIPGLCEAIMNLLAIEPRRE
ncbi:MAG: hypothetical protein EOM24_24580 [Chloroflexia bacterium]|nr:hypothetical protein [Chloroflexia bacterium]